MEDNEQDPLERFDHVLDRIEHPVTQLYVNQRQHSRVLRWLGLSLVFDVVLSLALGGLGLSIRSETQQRARSTCESGNEFRRLDLERWNYLLSLTSPTTPTTADQKKNTALFRSFIDQADEQRPC